MKRIFLFFIPLACFLAGQLIAQPAAASQAEVETFLMQEWIHSPVSASVDQHVRGECESGKSYIFSPESVLEIRECYKGRMRITRQTWSLNQSEFGDWQVKIADILYSLERKATPGKNSIVLTPLPPEEDAEATTPEPESIALYRLLPVAAEESEEEPE